MKKVLLVSPKPPPLHGETYAVSLLLESFPTEDIEIDHLNARFSRDVSDLQTVSFKKIWLLVKYLVQLVRLRFSNDYAAVILTPTFYGRPFLKDSLFVWVARILCFRRIIAWFHMDFKTLKYEESNIFRRVFIRWTLLNCSDYVCVSPRLVKALPDFVLKRNSTVAIENGVPDFPCKSNKAIEKRKGFRVVYFSFMSPSKGWKVLLEAARSLCAKDSRIEVLFYGRPADSPEYEIREVFGSDDCGGRIRFEGALQQGDKAGPLKAADLFCFPSLNEAFPLTILEAMALGLPIVASDVGGVADALIDNRGGRLVPPGSVSALEQALEDVASLDEVERNAMGNFNRQRFLEMFTTEAYGNRWKHYLRDL